MLIDYTVGCGITLAELLRSSPLTTDTLNSPTARVSAETYVRLLERAETLTGDHDLGLHMGENFHPGNYGAMGYLVLTSSSFRQAILNGIAYEPSSNTLARSRLFENGAEASVVWEGSGVLPRHVCESHAVTWLKFGRLLTGGRLDGHFMFPHPAPVDTSEHQRIFGTRVSFGQNDQAAVFDAGLLDWQPTQADPEINKNLFKILAQQSVDTPASTGPVEQARAFIAQNLHQGVVSLTDIATHLRLPVRTLQRKLRSSNLSYMQLLEDVRCELAKAYLGDERIQLTELTGLLGFSEQSAFQHAFKRWTGDTPGVFRKQLRH